MASLSSFKVNSKAIQTGAWVRAGDEFGNLELHVRGITDSYTNAIGASMRRAARPYSNNTTKIPAEVMRKLVIDCIDEHVLLDVRHLEDDEGKPITIDAFRVLLRDPNYPDLVEAVSRAAAQVGVVADEGAEADAKN